MKQVEITAYVSDNLDTAIQALYQKGFVISHLGRIDDKYLSQTTEPVSEDNVLDILSRSVLLRHIQENDKIYKKITYKKKEYLNGEVLSEEKYTIPCEDLDKAEQLFSALGFRLLVHVGYDVIGMQKGDMRFAFQVVDGLGVMVECESPRDFFNASVAEIKQEKAKLAALLKSVGLNIGADTDVKKAKELLLKKGRGETYDFIRRKRKQI